MKQQITWKNYEMSLTKYEKSAKKNKKGLICVVTQLFYWNTSVYKNWFNTELNIQLTHFVV